MPFRLLCCCRLLLLSCLVVGQWCCVFSRFPLRLSWVPLMFRPAAMAASSSDMTTPASTRGGPGDSAAPGLSVPTFNVGAKTDMMFRPATRGSHEEAGGGHHNARTAAVACVCAVPGLAECPLTTVPTPLAPTQGSIGDRLTFLSEQRARKRTVGSSAAKFRDPLCQHRGPQQARAKTPYAKLTYKLVTKKHWQHAKLLQRCAGGACDSITYS